MNLVWKKSSFYKYILPLVIVYTIFTFVPIVVSLYYSLTNFSGFGKYDYVGLKNFGLAFTDRFLWKAFGNTFLYAVLTLTAVTPLSFLMALAIQKKSVKTGIYRVIYFLPYTLGGAIVALMWRFIFDPNMGILNYVLRMLGISTDKLLWIGGPSLSPVSFSVITIWALSGFCMILWTNGLKQIAGDIIEASVIDGATKSQQVFLVMLPNMKSTIQTVLILINTTALKLFDYVYILTSGGPNHASESIVSYMYNMTFGSRLYGYGSAIAVIELIVAVTGSLLIIWAVNGKAGK